MLSFGKLSAGMERYYLSQAQGRVDVVASVGGGVEDYYGEGGEARGVWLGAGSARLGLAGAVGGEELRCVLEGRDPESGEGLRRRPVSVAGFDGTFSAPKSVSLLFALGGADVQPLVRAAHDTAVREAVGYLERCAAAVRRGAGGVEVHRAGGLVAAAFRHRTSRAGDPQLHTHVLIANLGHGPDGRWSALDARPLFGHARAASFLYQAVLRGELTRSLGLEWEPVCQGIAELAGVPKPVRRAFSRRRAAIEQELAEREQSGPRAAEAAALATRKRKDHSVDPRRLAAEWNERAERLGFGREQLREVIGRAPARELERAEWEALRAALLGPDGLTRGQEAFTRRDVLQAICQRLPAGTPIAADTLERAADWLLASPEVVPLAPADAELRAAFRRRDGRPMPVLREELRYSTAHMLRIERGLIAHALDGRDARLTVAHPTTIRRALRAERELSDEQRAMVERLCRDGDAIAVVCGRAGTGKTRALAAAARAWRDSGHRVRGAAVARRAAHELEVQAGIPSTSIHALLTDLRAGHRLPRASVLVIDEAGMVGTRALAELADHAARARVKLVLVGDPRQLPSIEAGGAFTALSRDPRAITLRDNRRQHERWERDAVELIRTGDAHEAITLYEQHDRLHIAPSEDDARGALVDRWWHDAQNSEAVMIAHRRTDVRDLNQRARTLMRAHQRLGADELQLPGGAFAVGDRVLIRSNHTTARLHTGDRATITAIDPQRRTLTLDHGGRGVQLHRWYLERPGEPTLQHGYAITGHAVQGATVDHAHILATRGLTQEWAYTALTRGRHSNHLYTAQQPDRARDDIAPTGHDHDPRAELIRGLSRRAAEPLAIDRLSEPRGRRRAPDHDRGLDLGW